MLTFDNRSFGKVLTAAAFALSLVVISTSAFAQSAGAGGGGGGAGGGAAGGGSDGGGNEGGPSQISQLIAAPVPPPSRVQMPVMLLDPRFEPCWIREANRCW